jgi:hypothetical protein
MLEHVSTATIALGGDNVFPANAPRRFLQTGLVGVVHATTLIVTTTDGSFS